MANNIGETDRYARMAIAALLVALVLFGAVSGLIAIIASVVAIVLIITATVKICPLYLLLGIKTHKE